MKKIRIVSAFFAIVIFLSNPVMADESDFSQLEMSFKNFIKCELTRTDAINPFKGKPFKITMIDLFDVQNESDIKIITGAVECFVVDKNQTLYTAVGLKTIMEKEQVLYYTLRHNDFSILATELIKYPYKERCNWAQYWINLE